MLEKTTKEVNGGIEVDVWMWVSASVVVKDECHNLQKFGSVKL